MPKTVLLILKKNFYTTTFSLSIYISYFIKCICRKPDRQKQCQNFCRDLTETN